MSLIVAVVLLPVLAKYFLKEQKVIDPNHKLWKRITNAVMNSTNSRVKRLSLASCLLILPVVITVIAMPKLDYLPPVKRDAIDANLQFPPGSNVKTIEKEIIQPIVERLKPYMDGTKEPALKNYYIFGGSFGGSLGVRVKDQDRVDDLLKIVREEILIDLPDTRVFARQGNLFGGFGGGRQVRVHLQSKDSKALEEMARQGMDWIKEAIEGANVNARRR